MTITNFRIEQDTDPTSPREWYPFGTFIMQHNRYEFGDRLFETDSSHISFEDDLAYHVAQIEDCKLTDIVYLPVYMYDHSGITINTTGFPCGWDSGQIGYIYVTKAQIREQQRVKRVSAKLKASIEEVLVAEIAELDDYLTGNIYGFIIDYEDGSTNSCWGFHDYDPETNGMFNHWTQQEREYYLENQEEIDDDN